MRSLVFYCDNIFEFWERTLASSSPSIAAAAAVASDRLWFFRHPNALVRFRPVRSGEFLSLESQGEVPPFYVPEALGVKAPLTWVAVVDLTRCLREDRDDPDLRLRVRLLTVPLRSRAMQRIWAPCYLRAVLGDLLNQDELWSDSDDFQAA